MPIVADALDKQPNGLVWNFVMLAGVAAVRSHSSACLHLLLLAHVPVTFPCFVFCCFCCCTAGGTCGVRDWPAMVRPKAECAPESLMYTYAMLRGDAFSSVSDRVLRDSIIKQPRHVTSFPLVPLLVSHFASSHLLTLTARETRLPVLRLGGCTLPRRRASPECRTLSWPRSPGSLQTW